MSELQIYRRTYIPPLPTILTKDVEVKKCEALGAAGDHDKIKALFPCTYGLPRVEYKECEGKVWRPVNIGVVLSGGQAPGGHNVIAGIYDFCKKVGGNMYGFRYGPRGVFTGKYVKIDDKFMDQYRNMGGFDMIGSGRDKIKGDEQFAASARVCAELELDGLIIIGGDDSNTNAALLAEYFQSIHHRTHVIGCPKTIDGDLKNDYIPLSFGFDTACKIYSELIGNICVDALSAQKYYHFVRLMGRSASHITMECAFETHPNYTFIGEEIKAKAKSVREITQEVVDLIVARAKVNKNYGVILLPEGLIEFIPEMGALIGELNDVIAAGHTEQADIASHLSEASRALFEYLPQTLKNQLTLDRDSHGNVKVSQIETEKFIVSCVEKELPYVKIDDKFMDQYRNMGGFDMIGSGRDKIKGDEQFAASARVCAELELDGLIIIGGDDSNTNAALLAEYFQSIHHRTHVIGCPKTIDGDLKNDYIPLSFGFDTACKIYSELIGNICVDALSAQKYYHFVRLMGRSASHITMECAFETHPNYTFIGEEIKAKAKSVREITQEVVDLIVARAKVNKNYGVILLPEGLIEFIPEMGALIGELNDVIAAGHTEQADIAAHLSEASRALFEYLPQTLKNQLTLDRDSHGNVKVSQIETEKFIVSCVEKELAELKKQGKYSGSFNSLCHFFGYEGRCGLPSCFDTNYCYALGYNAGILIHEGLNGMMSTISNLDQPVEAWTAGGVPITMMMNIERRAGKDEPVIKKALVELDGLPYKRFVEQSKEWMLGDCYSFPGPIQFTGPAANIVNQTLLYDIEARKARLGQ
ncbi:Phosphofructokinase PPi dependent [Blastocystis sp. ATCC 50177/Nand II]|uniref:Pyrophosphate--fructose 6-phosphate 1-phosphotransferase n=1 Tax=Blastocystis sp. subtype 1 (strain ATCC 50177 / NandII) TaxID=478820 RepID=A0A196SHQ8_BLAHN|nr:Phosphofructokinase PPi dependent [Blastocystis sp. ATCC 50177/Nand II]